MSASAVSPDTFLAQVAAITPRATESHASRQALAVVPVNPEGASVPVTSETLTPQEIEFLAQATLGDVVRRGGPVPLNRTPTTRPVDAIIREPVGGIGSGAYMFGPGNGITQITTTGATGASLSNLWEINPIYSSARVEAAPTPPAPEPTSTPAPAPATTGDNLPVPVDAAIRNSATHEVFHFQRRAIALVVTQSAEELATGTFSMYISPSGARRGEYRDLVVSHGFSIDGAEFNAEYAFWRLIGTSPESIIRAKSLAKWIIAVFRDREAGTVPEQLEILYNRVPGEAIAFRTY